jgi:hypothetical protein
VAKAHGGSNPLPLSDFNDMARYTVSRSGADCKSAVFGLGWCDPNSRHQNCLQETLDDTRDSAMNKMNYKEAVEKAKEINKTLSYKDLNGTVCFRHGDGSECKYANSTYIKEDEWIFIFTEHHGVLVYHCEDLDRINMTT